jgi:hypothetical protein
MNGKVFATTYFIILDNTNAFVSFRHEFRAEESLILGNFSVIIRLMIDYLLFERIKAILVSNDLL